MIVIREPQDISEWFVTFHKASPSWYGRLVPGRFKHVSVFGFAARTKTWVLIDLSFSGVGVTLLPEGTQSVEMLAGWTTDCAVLKIKANRGQPLVYRGPLTCVSFARHLVGSRCVSIRPDAFYRALIQQGATVIIGQAAGLT